MEPKSRLKFNSQRMPQIPPSPLPPSFRAGGIRVPNQTPRPPERPKLVKPSLNQTVVRKKSKQERPAWFVGNYQLRKELGQGSYGTVYLATSKTNNKFAIKCYDKSKLCDLRRKSEVRREISILQQLKHRNVIRLVEVLDQPKQLSLVMEYAGSQSLWSYLKDLSGNCVPEEEAKGLFRQIVQGVNFCHNQQISHRDIKLENVLLDENHNVKLIDFGFATCIPHTKKMKLFLGTPCYMAPEIVDDKEYSGDKADVWALGILLYCLLVGFYPFTGNTQSDLFKNISKSQLKVPNKLGSEVKDLLSWLLQKSPNKRPTCSEVLEHRWLGSGVDNEREVIDFMVNHGYFEPQILESLESAENEISQKYHELLEKRNTGLELNSNMLHSLA